MKQQENLNGRENIKPQIIVIAGPTASGKTKLSVELAKKINGEIISADSMQIYKDMNIGTAKVTPDEMQGIKHYLIDYISPEERYSVSQYKNDAEKSIEEVITKGKIPIVVGGTGLYIDSLIYGIEFEEQTIDEEYRAELNKIAQENGLEMLYQQALKIDEEATKKISPNDRKRIIRILEIYKQTGKTKTEQNNLSRQNGIKYDYKVFILSMDREILYNSINERVDKMVGNGLVEEVQNLLLKYKQFPTAIQGLGYKEVIEFLENRLTKEEMIEKIKQETRHYAKRQLTWFRKNKQAICLDSQREIEENIETILSSIQK